MQILATLSELPAEVRGGALTIGNFDGVHLGHARLLDRLRRAAQAVGGPAVVFTFDPHPVRLLRPEQAPPPLTWTDRKAELLEELGVDVLVAYPTDEELLRYAPREFFDRIIVAQLGARALVEGPNFYFGHRREGTIATLRAFCEQAEIRLEIVEPVRGEGDLVSSSRIRAQIRQGDVGAARRMLTRPYRIRGIITHGAARGGRIGFPTANLEGTDTLVPAPGVYAGRALVADAHWPAAINIGPNPTFGELAYKIEVHLIGFSGNLYGQLIAVDFFERLRDIQPFPDVRALQEQLHRDVSRARQISEEQA